MKKPTDSYSKSASQEAVHARLAQLEKPPIGLPHSCTAVSMLTDNATNQLRRMAQALVRTDIDAESQRATTLAACKLARGMLDGVIKQLGGKS